MKLQLTVPALFSLASLAAIAACGASDATQSSAASAADAGPSVDAALLGGQPCTIKSGYIGDDLCITAPDPAYGFQFHYGPSDYTNADEVAKYVLMPGEEVTDCVFFMTPNAETVYFNEYHARMRPGSHHMLLYVQPAGGVTETTPATGPAACSQGPQTRNLFGATSPTLDVKNFDAAEENQGLAVSIPATQQGVMQLHFINTGTTPLLREAWANILYTPKSDVKTLADPIFWLGGLGMSITMGESTTIHGTAHVPSTAGKDFRLVAATPHFHTHLTRFEVTMTVGGKTTTVLEQFPTLNTLSEPQIRFFDSVTQNPAIDVAARKDGAYSGDIYLKPGDTLDWYCDVNNDDQPNPLQFTEQVYLGEMCNVFGLYAPSNGGPWNAFNL